MIKFLLKGLIRDKSRSRLPIIVVAVGVTLTVLMHAYISGFMGDIIEMNARFTSGHVKIMTKAYNENLSQLPNDLAIVNVQEEIKGVSALYPDIEWSPRIHFGGLIDVPGDNGETRSQGPSIGMGVDLLSPGTREPDRLNLRRSIVRGRLPEKPGEAILSEAFSQKLKVNPGDDVTLIGSTMDGGMAFYNFTISGTVSLGVEALDRGTIIADIGDVQMALNMEDSAGEIIGIFRSGFYDDALAKNIAGKFTEINADSTDEFAPIMLALGSQGTMGTYVSMAESWTGLISMIFIFAMSLVLWNAGLLGGLRRYGEVGIRLAMGESKGHVYRTMIWESVMIGIVGSVIGTILGLTFAWLIQTYGIDISSMSKGSSMMMPTIIRARISPVDFYIGFIPGLFSTVIGTMLAGRGIYKRETARLFKELES